MNEIVTKKCSKCHENKPLDDFYFNKRLMYERSNICKECAKAKTRKWSKDNKELKKQLDKKYRQAHPEKYRAYRAKWKKNNYEQAKECALNWWRNNKEISKVNLNLWRKNNPEKYKVQSALRRARSESAEGSFTTKEWIDLCNKYHNKCLACGRKVKLTIDHIVPISKGGSHYIENIQPLCGSCNSSKLNKVIDYR